MSDAGTSEPRSAPAPPEDPDSVAAAEHAGGGAQFRLANAAHFDGVGPFA